ncbi:hypothetical protein [Salinarimonas sp.]|uniref:hypothetical protein n=1 Tax=Salinarimonas sp. TaxID=2766526 RepID=UPI00391A88C6
MQTWMELEEQSRRRLAAAVERMAAEGSADACLDCARSVRNAYLAWFVRRAARAVLRLAAAPARRVRAAWFRASHRTRSPASSA